ncbi:hypothetical protein JCM10207_000569 [Rhodosporidiobolus poonsookiae]
MISSRGPYRNKVRPAARPPGLVASQPLPLLQRLPDPTKPAYPLPPEITLHVLEELANDPGLSIGDRSRNSARLALVSRTFARLTVPLLYQVVELQPEDLAQSTRLVRSLEKGAFQHVKELSLNFASKDGPGEHDETLPSLREGVFRLFRQFTNLEEFSNDLLLHSRDTRDLLILCLPRWPRLRVFAHRCREVAGEAFAQCTALKTLDVGSVAFQSSTPSDRPFPLTLSTLCLMHLWGTSLRPAFDHLVSSSHITLTNLSLRPFTGTTILDLRSLTSLRRLLLYFNFEDNGEEELAHLAATLRRSPPALTHLGLEAEQYLSFSGNVVAELDLLRSLPPSIRTFTLSAFPPLPVAYLTRILVDRVCLPRLQTMVCAHDSEDDAHDLRIGLKSIAPVY